MENLIITSFGVISVTLMNAINLQKAVTLGGAYDGGK